MTRINIVHVTELCDQHLLAEHRELTRIPNGIIKGKLKWDYSDRPTSYTVGAGHIKFFTNKLYWLRKRYSELLLECNVRGFDVQNIWPAALDKHLPLAAFKDYEPMEEELAINRARIKERMPRIARFTKRVHVRGLPIGLKQEADGTYYWQGASGSWYKVVDTNHLRWVYENLPADVRSALSFKLPE